MEFKSIALAAMIALACSSQVFSEPALGSEPKPKTDIVEHESAGNLEVTHILDCVGFDQISNRYTPADLYAATAKCVDAEDFSFAVQLFALAGVYGVFDQQRVADQTAHQAIEMLQRQAFQNKPPESRNKLRDYIVKDFTPGSPQLIELCDQIREIGAPDYFPRYMIQHGMGAFLPGEKSSQGIKDGFKPDTAWESALNTYLHCPSSESLSN